MSNLLKELFGQLKSITALSGNERVIMMQAGEPCAANIRDITGEEVYNAKQYGAKGDGVTDDRIAINALIADVNRAGGGVVYLPAGTYVVSRGASASVGCILLLSNVKLKGAGIGITTIKLADGSDADVSGIVRTPSGERTDNASVIDLTIDGNGENQESGEQYGFYCGVTPGKRVSSITNVSGDTYRITMVTAADLPVGPTVTIIQSNTAAFNTEFTISNRNTGAGTADITVTGSPSNDTTGSIYIYDDADDQIYDYNITCTRVEVKNCTGYGFDPHEQVHKLLFEDCTAHHNGLGGSFDGFTIDFCKDARLVNCTAHDNTRHGINVVTSSEAVDIVNPNCHNNGSSGIVVQTGSDYRQFTKSVTITGGRTYRNVKSGILVNFANFNTVDGTHSYENGEHGVRIEGASYNTLGDTCHVYNNSQTANNTSDEVRIMEDTVDAESHSDVYGSTFNTIRCAIYSTLPNKAKYAVNEVSSANDNNVIEPGRINGQVNSTPVLVTGANSRFSLRVASSGVLATKGSINAKSTGTTTLYAVPTGKTAIITLAVVRCTAATSITTAATAGIGVAAGEADLFAAVEMTNLHATTDCFYFVPAQGKHLVVAAGSAIKLGIDGAATGTSQTLVVELIGYLI